MKTLFTISLLAIFALGVNAQYLPLPENFEAIEADTAWHQFSNGGDLPENFVLTTNPAMDDTNDSDFCIEFTVLDEADLWVGAWAEAYGPQTITEENAIWEMMVYKNVISNCGIKFEKGTDAMVSLEVKVPNTVTEAWELITFDMSEAIGNSFDRLTLFVDFPDTRTAGSLCYFDNVGPHVEPTSLDEAGTSGFSIYPNPATDRITVDYPGINSVTITNVLGQQINSLEFLNSDLEIIDVTDLQPGIYFINLETTSGLISSKFIRE